MTQHGRLSESEVPMDAPLPHPDADAEITRISPEQETPLVPWREIWHYRDLVLLLARRDFVMVYQQTILGPLWFVVQPVLMALMFHFIFGRMVGASTEGLPSFVFYFCGIVAWNYIGDLFMKTANIFHGQAHVFGKVWFPRLVVPLATALYQLTTFVVQWLLLLGVIAWNVWRGAPIQPGWALLGLPVLLLLMAMLSLGLGCFFSAATVRFRDLILLLGFGTQIWMFASGVFFPLNQIPAAWQWLAILNPALVLVETFRQIMTGSSGPGLWPMLIAAGECLLVFLLGLRFFQKAERTFLDTI